MRGRERGSSEDRPGRLFLFVDRDICGLGIDRLWCVDLHLCHPRRDVGDKGVEFFEGEEGCAELRM